MASRTKRVQAQAEEQQSDTFEGSSEELDVEVVINTLMASGALEERPRLHRKTRVNSDYRSVLREKYQKKLVQEVKQKYSALLSLVVHERLPKEIVKQAQQVLDATARLKINGDLPSVNALKALLEAFDLVKNAEKHVRFMKQLSKPTVWEEKEASSIYTS